MTTEAQGQGTGAPDANTESKQQNETELSNRDVKSHPLFQKLATDYSAAAKRLEALEAAENARQAKAAEDAKDYEKAAQLKADAAVAEARRAWEAEQSKANKFSEAKFQLVKSGFKNEKFIKGLLADFDPEKQNPEEFAKAAASDKENALFLDSITGKKPASNPDPQHPPAGRQGRLTDEEIENLKKSSKPEERAAAYAAARLQWIEENKGKAV